MKVEKRDGKTEAWSDDKLMAAIAKAATEVGEVIEDVTAILQKIKSKIATQEDTVHVAKLHEAVENVLMGSRYKNVARAYISKRSERDKERESGSKIYKDIQGFLEQSSDEFTRENANKASGVVSTHRDLLAGIVSKHLMVTQIMSEDVAEAHRKGVVWTHDQDYSLSPLTNCCLVNYPDMLENGFKLGDAAIESPKSIGVATTVLTQIAQAVASSQYGGQTHPHIDRYLSPYVERSWKKIKAEQLQWNLPDEWADAKIEKEVYDAMQSLLYQVNSLTTTNGQQPFQTISLGLDTSRWGRLITKCYLAVHEAGLGKEHITPTFPKVVFFLQEGVNLKAEDPNYDLKKLAVRCSTKRIYPDYVSVPRNKEITGSDDPVSPMGCRSFLSDWKDKDGTTKLNGRFNLGVVSLNLGYIAKEAEGCNEKFFNLLSHYGEIAFKSHMERVDRLKGTKAKQNPTMWMHGALARLGPEDTIEPLFYDGYASISLGFVGLYEACTWMGHEHDKEYAFEVLTYLNQMCKKWKEQTGLSFSLYGTPSENLCYQAAEAIKRDFGDCVGKKYLTNSFHLPVWIKAHPQEKWGWERGFDELSNGGNIVYVETPNLQRNLEAYEGLLDYAYHTGLHYFAINTPVDRCFECGYEGEFTPNLDGFTCPCCGNNNPDTVSVIRRVSGYISAPNARPFNKGKMQEVIERVKHTTEKE